MITLSGEPGDQSRGGINTNRLEGEQPRDQKVCILVGHVALRGGVGGGRQIGQQIVILVKQTINRN